MQDTQQASTGLPVSTSESPDMPVHFSGSVKLSYMGIPMNTVLDLSDHGAGQAFLTAWVDKTRGQSAHVHFQEANTGLRADDTKGRVVQTGTFVFSLPFRHQDPNLLKLQFCLRMQDSETRNRRSMELCMSYAEMDKMLRGGCDRFRIVNQFDTSITADVALSISNAKDFRNHPTSANDCGKPYLTLSPSHLTQLKAVNRDAEGVSCYIGRVLKKNGCAMPPGGAPFEMGLTRCGLFFSADIFIVF